jgi:uncharacterized membrane protein
MDHFAASEQPLKVEVSLWFNRAWDCFLANVWISLLIGLIAVVLITALLPLVGPVAAGLALTGTRRCRQGRVQIEDFFQGFGNMFLGTLAAGLLILLFSFIGFIFLIIPGLVILSMYMFTFNFMEDRGQDFWQAMESSRKLVARDYLGFTIFGLALLAVNCLGVILVVGPLVTAPLTAYAVSAAYHDCAGSAPQPTPQAAPVRID